MHHWYEEYSHDSTYIFRRRSQRVLDRHVSYPS